MKTTNNTTTETPIMKQYNDLKKKHPDALLLFRCGDFYETYNKDAEDAAEILGITLTKRNNGASQGDAMAGFPYHALDTYLPKLVRAGKRIAICEQLEDPKGKTLVKRGVTELISPTQEVKPDKLPPLNDIAEEPDKEASIREEMNKRMEELESRHKDELLALARIVIKELSTIPGTLNQALTNSIGILNMAKLKFQCGKTPTQSEIDYLIRMTERAENNK